MGLYCLRQAAIAKARQRQHQMLMNAPNLAVGEKQTKSYLEAHPVSYTAHYNLGNLLLNQGKYREAVKELQAAIALNGEHAESFHDLALCLLRLGNFADALRLTEVSIGKLAKTDPRGYNLKGAILAGTSPSSRENMRDAIKAFKKSLFFDEAQAPVHRSLARIYASLGMQYDAANHFKRSLQLDPWHEMTYRRYGKTLVSLGKTSEAARILEEWSKFKRDKQKKLPVN